MENEHDYLLKMESVTKTFPGVKALDNVDLKVKEGTVHALLGENGAGKSTLMKVLMGIYEPDEGTVVLQGDELGVANIGNRLESGISMIHQELTPIPHMTVAENIYLNREPTHGSTMFVDKKKLIEDTAKLFDRLNIDIDPTVEMKELTIANMQMVEIAKAISYDAKLIIMDEPTSSITEKEVDHLFKLINDLRDDGISIIYITHKMDEVFQIADDVTVLRDGEYIGTELAENLSEDDIVSMMVGRDLGEIFDKQESEIKDVILSAKNFSYEAKGPLEISIKDVSFEVRRGEVLGISGLVGSGRSELIEMVFGVNKPDTGEVYIDGKRVEINNPKEAIDNGLALVPEDRHELGLFLPLSVKDNLITPNINSYLNNGFLNEKRLSSDCEGMRERLNIKTPHLQQTVDNLSGGNQQKVVIGKWLLTEPDILILDEPTRGIDVGAKEEVHNIVSELAQDGKAIIMISSEMPEILGMSDRIMVMHEGKKMGELTREEADQEKIMRLAAGSTL